MLRVNVYKEHATGLEYQTTETRWRKQLAVGSNEWTEWELFEDADEDSPAPEMTNGNFGQVFIHLVVAACVVAAWR